MRRLRVGIDCHSVGGIHQGIRTHVLELFSRATGLATDLEFVFLASDPEAMLGFSPGFSATNSEVLPLKHSGPVSRLLLQLPALQRRLKLDLFHSQYIIPPFLGCPAVVTIHDVLFETHPQFFTPFFTLRSKVLMRAAAKRAAAVFTVSEYSKAQLQHLYGMPPDRVSVISNAANLSRFTPGAAGSDDILRRGLVPGNFILTVGRLEPRKNHASLLRAYERLGADAPPLVIIGQRHFAYDEVVRAATRERRAGRVIVLEDVSDSELPSWYRHALCFIYPSWAEGFGMPVIEAFASGVPVVCSRSTALTEIAESAALLVNPGDVDAIASGLRQLIGSPDLRMKLSALGLDRAMAYNWSESAETLVRAYRELLSRGTQPDGGLGQGC